MTTLAYAPTDDHDLLHLVADTQSPLGQDDADRFEAACRAVAVDGWVNPSHVREHLMVAGELQIHPRRYSALWSAACSKSGFMDVRRDRLVPITGAGSRGNGNKQICMRKLRSTAGNPLSSASGPAGAPTPPARAVPPHIPPGRDGAT